ncbi:PhoH family protein [Ancylomarina sp. 16SWW S1-10-2]|uniref:PhoH family protein n=1 Tax=Ancylomarina sp. 16SWW S1-10-2 TaxID=2499681 RepID=UPI0012AE65A6|nr:PhoH family protein [Ancylomarina sp. 16SWW S1-10-2]MRT92867.1 PhoH family protein [Ancylomarina sp. 16SWW S1-10-2]
MIERYISIGSIDPLDFYGINNNKLEILKDLFPKLQIVGRGSELIVKGEQKSLDLFENKINLILQHYNQYNVLTAANLKRIVLENTKEIEDPEDPKNIIVFGNNGKIIRSRTPNQRKLVQKSANNDMIFAIGPAGSGKTYTAVALAVKALRNNEVKRIILSRPAVEAGENLGFLPGDLKEKIDPYLQPLYDALLDMIPPNKLAAYLEADVIQIAPLAYMRGRTLNDAFVILDEAQNTTSKQLKMFLTRMGTSGKFMITGDITQIDLPRRQQSGLVQAFRILKDIKDIAMVEFDTSDIVRHQLVKKIVSAYEIDEEKEAEKWKKKE